MQKLQSVISSFKPSSRLALFAFLSIAALVGSLIYYNQSVVAYPADEFVTTWKTDNPGTSNSTSITIPTTGTGYNYSVDWNNDGVVDQTGLTGSVTHDYGTAGTYTVRIKGTFPRIYFNNGGDKSKILSVEQWGTNAWTSMNRAFFGANNLVINASDTPNLNSVTDMQLMFQEASLLGGGTGNWSWNTSTVTNMTQLFQGAVNFNKDITSWNTSNVTTLSGMFRNAYVFNQNISTWNTSNVTNMYYMFGNATSFNQPIGIWNTSKVTDMGNMFDVATSFNQPIGTWDISKVTNMYRMFMQASSFNQPLNSWDTSKVTNMMGTFRSATAFNGNISNWNTISVTNFSEMFYVATSFNQNIDSWNTSNAITMSSMFSSASSFNQNVNGWNTGNVINMSYMFAAASSFNRTLNSWNITKVTNATGMFQSSKISTDNYDDMLNSWNTQTLKPNVAFSGGNSKYCNATAARANMIASDNWTITDGGNDCSKATKAANTHFVTTWKTDNPGTSNSTSITIPTSGTGYNYDVDWDGDGRMDQFGVTGSVTHDFGTAGTKTIRIQGAFPLIYFNNSGDKSKILSVEQWGTNVWSSMYQSFFGANNLVVNATDTPNLSSASSLYMAFRNATSLTGSSGNWDWDTSNVTNFRAMFQSATNFDGDIGSWNMSNATAIGYMFYGATNFNQDIGNWDVGNVTDMAYVFASATSFNQDIGTWDTSKVNDTNNMFNGATGFNQNISNWDTSSLVYVYSMFRSANSFNQPINDWDMSNVTSLNSMFSGATSFNQNIDSWDTSNVTDMSSIFQGASAFNQDISSWNTENVVSTSFMFFGTSSFNQPLASWDMSNVTNMQSMFQQSAFNQDIGSWNVVSVTNAINMFFGTTLSVANYDSLLTGWNAQTLKPNVNFHGGNSKYCAGTPARANMIASDNWTIADGGKDCSQAKPTDVKLAGSHTKAITENNAVGGSLGALSVTDLTPSDTHTYAFTCTTPGADDSFFTTNASGTSFTTNQSFDYETPVDADSDNAYEVCVRVTDSTGNTYDQNLTIAIANANAAPTGVTVDGASNKNINENNPANSTIATLATIDDGEDNPETYSYTLDCTTPGADDALFSTTGTDLKANQSFNYETPADADADNTYNICVKSTETNGGLSTERNLTITVLDVDDTPPVTSGALDLTDASDTGSSSTDNLTNDTTPSLAVICSEADATVKIYSDQPSANTLIATHTCTTVGNVEVTVQPSDALGDAVHSITSTETDSSNNVSDPSPALVITIDATASTPPSITPPANVNELPSQTPVLISGTGVVGETIEVTSTPDGGGTTSTCTTTVDNDGTYSCTLSPQPALGSHNLSVTTTDLAGNTSTDTTASFTMALDTDGDGQIDTEDADEDNDGIPGAIEDAGFNNGDGNGDGIKDSLQANVATQANPVTGGSTTLEVTQGCQVVTSFDVLRESELASQDQAFRYPVGLNDFSLQCDQPGQTATVTFYYNQTYDTNTWTYKKYNTTGNTYTDISEKVSYGTKQVGGTNVTTAGYQLTDGGPLDQDGQANGSITDPAGPGVEIPKTVGANNDLAETGESVQDMLVLASIIILLGCSVRVLLNHSRMARSPF